MDGALIATLVKVGVKLVRWQLGKPRGEVKARCLQEWDNFSLWQYFFSGEKFQELDGKVLMILRTPEGEFVVDPSLAEEAIRGTYQYFEACLASRKDGRDAAFERWLNSLPFELLTSDSWPV